ncbi:MAG: hypothetical protein PHE27_05460 [Alphaproteobacteria bacterium]|nr:hypothetical protein [Alphaproteobacteria bacterium]
MTATQQDLRRFTGLDRLLLIDRSDLPHEDAFKKHDGLDPYGFDARQLDERTEKLLALPGMDAVWGEATEQDLAAFKRRLSMACGWTLGIKNGEPWTRETRAMGREIFGAWFDLYPQGTGQSTKALIVPRSSHLKSFGLLNGETERGSVQSGTTCSVLHEAAHLRFVYPETKKLETRYFEEALADGFMAHVRLYGDVPRAPTATERLKRLFGRKPKPGAETKPLPVSPEGAAEVRAWIYERRMDAFFGISNTSYWTAAAIEATVQKERIPKLADVFYTVRGLQLRAGDTLVARKQGRKNPKTYSPHERQNVIGYEGYMDKKEVRDPEMTLREFLEKFSPKDLIEALAEVLRTHDLEPDTRAEGEKIVEAYNYFCPQNAVVHSPSCPASETSKIPVLAAVRL